MHGYRVGRERRRQRGDLHGVAGERDASADLAGARVRRHLDGSPRRIPRFSGCWRFRKRRRHTAARCEPSDPTAARPSDSPYRPACKPQEVYVATLAKSRFSVIRVPSLRNASASRRMRLLASARSWLSRLMLSRSMYHGSLIVVHDVGLDDLARDRQRRVLRHVVHVAIAGLAQLLVLLGRAAARTARA